MPVPLDVITRRKLILVRQIYQRAVLQSEVLHSDFDRIMSLIAFDLATETVLKAVVGAVEPAKTADKDFQSIIQQADALLLKKGLPEVPDKPKIQHVHGLRNDAQHKAKYPNDNDVNDCRTYTRDFLQQIINNVWGENFESISLVDLIQNPVVKGHLVEAEAELAKGEFTQAVVKAMAAFKWAMDKIKGSIVADVPWNIKAIVVGGSFDKIAQSTELLKSFEQLRGITLRSVLGINFQSYRKYTRITYSTAIISFARDGSYKTKYRGHNPDAREAEFVIEFATNAIIQVESLVGDIDKPFEV